MPPALGNLHEYSVSELAGAVKRVVEDGFALVRVRGEVSKVTRASSGHLYFDLKDDKAVLSSVVWKGFAERLKTAPEQGMEVIATGRLTTFPGQSRYQLVVDSLEPAGVGALMALLEERKRKLSSEGLFAPERKRAIPFLPDVIGVVTSPSGAVIRDILHRLRERFPRHVMVWPTLVQGKGAEASIAAAIAGFNALTKNGDPPRPDVLIVARGGGSIEDLWCFNEEIVVRAAAASAIPLISAVGHETDTTLIDFAADRRAPTPSAAAELAVPVRRELVGEILNKERRMLDAGLRLLATREASLRAATRGLGRPEDVTGPTAQRLDRAGERLTAAWRARRDGADARLAGVAARVRPSLLARALGQLAARAERVEGRLAAAAMARLGDARARLAARRLSASALQRLSQERARRGAQAQARLARAGAHVLVAPKTRLAGLEALLGSLSHHSILRRGFALVRGPDGAVIASAEAATPGLAVQLAFSDGVRHAQISAPDSRRDKKPPPRATRQQSLFDAD